MKKNKTTRKRHNKKKSNFTKYFVLNYMSTLMTLIATMLLMSITIPVMDEGVWGLIFAIIFGYFVPIGIGVFSTHIVNKIIGTCYEMDQDYETLELMMLLHHDERK